MTTAPVRSGVSSRSRGPQTFETGLHADADFGTIDVGLAVDAGTFGVVIDAPVVGRLRAAFEVSADGSTRLSSLARRTTEGIDVKVSLFDESKTEALEAELQQTRDAYAQLSADNDDHSQILQQTGNELAATRAELERLEASLNDALNTVALEREARLALLGEREEARAEIELVRGELDAGTAALMREVNEARSAHDAVEAERARLSDELTELASTLDRHREELNAGNIAQAQLSADLEASADARSVLRREIERLEASELHLIKAREALKRELSDAATSEVHLTQDLSSLRTENERALEGQAALQQALDEANAARDLVESKLGALTLQLDDSNASRERLEQELEDIRSSAHGERTSVEQTLIELREVLAAKEKQLSASAAERHEMGQQHEEALASVRSALSSAENDAGGYSAELAGLRATSAIEAERLALEVTKVQVSLETAEQERELLREQVEQTSAQLQQLQSDHEVTQQALDEAQRSAAEHEAANAGLLTERNEARNVARNLHQRIASGGGVDALKAELVELRSSLDSAQTTVTNVMTERDRAQLQIEALGRQIDQERSARAKAVAERDQYRDRFRALTSNANTGETRALSSQDETKSYASTSDFSGEAPIDSPTDVTRLPVDFDKAKNT